MGQLSSTGINSIHISLGDLIKGQINELITNSSLWLHPDACKGLATMYTDRLTQYEYSDLLGVALAIGVRIKQPTSKRSISIAIVSHYCRCFELLRIIWKGLRRIHPAMTDAIHSRNGMGSKSEIDRFFCHQKDCDWVTQKSIEWEHDKTSIRLISEYNRSIDKLLKIMNAVYVDINNRITDQRFGELFRATSKIMNRLDTVSELLIRMTNG